MPFDFFRWTSAVGALAMGVALTGCDTPRADAGFPHRRVDLVEGSAPARSQAAAPPHLTLEQATPTEQAAGALLPAALDAHLEVREPTSWSADRSWSGPARLTHAKRAKQDEVSHLFERAGVAFPAKELLFRVFKKEAQVEVWAGGGAGPLARVATYGICAASGVLGPKRAEGDLQVPEGFYTLSYFHPESAYYLAALVDYPNLSDKIRGTQTPGGQIMMHGSCASIGCISMTDERMEELYLMAWSTWRDRGTRTHVHIFPGRDLAALIDDPAYAPHHAFWRELSEGKSAFETTGRIPRITVAPDGSYVVGGA